MPAGRYAFSAPYTKPLPSSPKNSSSPPPVFASRDSRYAPVKILSPNSATPSPVSNAISVPAGQSTPFNSATLQSVVTQHHPMSVGNSPDAPQMTVQSNSYKQAPVAAPAAKRSSVSPAMAPTRKPMSSYDQVIARNKYNHGNT